MVLNLSPENQSLLATRRNRLLTRQTPAEMHVGALLTQLGIRHMPQKGFFTATAHFIVDFYLPKPMRICLEIDGGYHLDAEQVAYDARRTAYLENERGFLVLRLTNEQALALDANSLFGFLNNQK